MISTRDLGKYLSLGSLERAPTSGQNGWTSNSRLMKRVGFGAIAFIFSVVIIGAMVKLTPSHPTQYVSDVATKFFISKDPEDMLFKLDAKYAHLRDDKFTYVGCRTHLAMVGYLLFPLHFPLGLSFPSPCLLFSSFSSLSLSLPLWS